MAERWPILKVSMRGLVGMGPRDVFSIAPSLVLVPSTAQVCDTLDKASHELWSNWLFFYSFRYFLVQNSHIKQEQGECVFDKQLKQNCKPHEYSSSQNSSSSTRVVSSMTVTFWGEFAFAFAFSASSLLDIVLLLAYSCPQFWSVHMQDNLGAAGQGL